MFAAALAAKPAERLAAARLAADAPREMALHPPNYFRKMARAVAARAASRQESDSVVQALAAIGLPERNPYLPNCFLKVEQAGARATIAPARMAPYLPSYFLRQARAEV
jgi:hypothetical protein